VDVENPASEPSASVSSGTPVPVWKREPVLLAAILVLAAILRLYQLGSNPPGLFRDEAAIAVNAYSLGVTGRALNGEFLPLHPHEETFKHWGSPGIVYKPIFTYAVIPFVRIFGLSETVVRLPAVLFGLLGVVGVCLLGRRLFGPGVGLLSAFLLALSPWHLHFSRVAFEAISLPACLTLGSWLLWRGLEQPKFLPFGAVVLALTIYCYPTAQVFTPLLLGAFAVLNLARLRELRRPALLGLALFAGVVAPNFLQVLGNVHQERVHELMITSGSLEGERGIAFVKEFGALGQNLLECRPFLTAVLFLYNYATYLSPSYLFIDGDPQLQNHVQGMGMCFASFIPLLLAGVVALWRERHTPRAKFLAAWLLLFPVAPSLTINTPHAIRSLHATPVLMMIAAVGLALLLQAAREAPRPERAGRALNVVARVLLGSVVLTLPWNALVFLNHRFVDYPVTSASAWQAGIGEALRETERRKEGVERITVSSRIHNPFVFIAFYTPVDFRALAVPGREVNDKLAPTKYRIALEGGIEKGGLWLITAEERRDHPGARTVAEFPFPDGSPNLMLVSYSDR